jgi:hypothetical protein
MTIANDGEVVRDAQPGKGGGDQFAQLPSTYHQFRNVHADQYPYNAHAMLAMLMRRLLGISGGGPVGPREELMINGLKADPKLPPELYADPDISPLAVRPRNVPQPRTSY